MRIEHRIGHAARPANILVGCDQHIGQRALDRTAGHDLGRPRDRRRRGRACRIGGAVFEP
jgi:hypothetical protein